jgi:hypothetical protein
MIGYFLSAGDEIVSNIFTPYVWKENGLGTLLDKEIKNKNYGNDLELLLIKYYVEGRFDVNGPSFPKVSSYSKKNKDIAVDITVTPELFHNRNEFERREFIIDSTLNAVKLVRDKLSPKNLAINFDELLSDVTSVRNSYLQLK